jgi:hypothetical protein
MPTWRHPPPLSGFLRKPVEVSDGRASGAVFSRQVQKKTRGRASETRIAPFEAFPVSNGRDYAIRITSSRLPVLINVIARPTARVRER